MIQFYINSRPVPRAIARHHLAQARPELTPAAVDVMLKWHLPSTPAAKQCAAYGVSVAKI